MKLQMIYSFFVADDECNNEVYELHYNMLNQISSVFDKITFIICHNGYPYDDIIKRIKYRLIDIIHCNNISFIYEQNNPNYREGIIYKKYIIDKLDQYDDYITFFAHTKGVTNKDGLYFIDNLKLWIFGMYYLNFRWLNEMKRKLNTYVVKNDYDMQNDYFSFGGIYFKDYRHNNVHNWFYSGSFQWINTYKINKYIKENNIDIKPFICEEDKRLYSCAELFLGSIFDESHVAFHYDEHYNKQTNHYNMYGWEVAYLNSNDMIKLYLKIDEYNDFCKNYRELKIYD